jgi:hypothetical protein
MSLSQLIAILAFAIALLMHLFGWGSGKVDVLTFTLIGLLCLALSGVGPVLRVPWKRNPPA